MEGRAAPTGTAPVSIRSSAILGLCLPDLWPPDLWPLEGVEGAVTDARPDQSPLPTAPPTGRCQRSSGASSSPSMPPSLGRSPAGGKRPFRGKGACRRGVRPASVGRVIWDDGNEPSVALILCHASRAGVIRLPILEDADAKLRAGDRRLDPERLFESESRRSRPPPDAGRQIEPELGTFGDEAGIGKGEKRTAGTVLANVPK